LIIFDFCIIIFINFAVEVLKKNTMNNTFAKTITEEQLAEWYSKLEIGEDSCIDFYVDILKKYKAPMLEVNCGTGKILTRLQELGVYCDGLEASKEQLSICSERLNAIGKEAQLFNADFSDVILPNKYNAIFIPHGTFCIIADIEKAKHCLDLFFSALENGGTLVLDVFVPWKAIEKHNDKCWKISRTYYDPKTGEDFVFSYFDDFDFASQVRTTHLKYEVFCNGELVSVRFDVVRNHWYGNNELKLMLEKAGFDSVTSETVFYKSSDDYSTLFTASKLK